jgi:diaminopimelate epimerase
MSTPLHLVKHHGFGNDFLIAFHVHRPEDELAALARAVCDRRRGIGADGLLIGDSDPEVSAQMVLFNADGSRAEMSGNGVRCFAHAVAMRAGRAAPWVPDIRTDAGVRRVELVPSGQPHTVVATAHVGEVSDIAPPPGWDDLGVDPQRPAAHLSVGNPHTTVAVDDLDAVDLASLGASLPGVNLEIVVAGAEPHAVRMRVHERGAGITEACGTGAVAVAVAASRWGLATPRDGKLVVHMDGGSASVALENGDGVTSATLSGPVTYIATIEFPDPYLR